MPQATDEAAEPESLVAANRKGPAWKRTLTFAAVFLTWNLVWWAPIAFLMHDVVPAGSLWVYGFALVALLPMALFVHAFQTARPPPAWTRVWLLRSTWYVQLLIPLVSILSLIGILVGLAVGEPLAVGRATLPGVLLFTLVLAALGYAGANRTTLRRLDLYHPRLPAALEGLRVVQLSDLHLGPHSPPRQIARIRSAVEDAQPHLITLTGDQVDDHAPDIATAIAALAGVDAPLGVFAVPGNHDVFIDWGSVHDAMKEAGWNVLVNDARPVEHEGATLWVTGTGDPAAESLKDDARSARPDPEATFRDVPGDAFVLSLVHNPKLWPKLAKLGAHLTLAGHTHHAQVSIPRWNWCLASPILRHAMGHHVDGEAVLYVSPGTHYWGVPFRLGAWPEVTLVTLHRATDGTARMEEGFVRRIRDRGNQTQ